MPSRREAFLEDFFNADGKHPNGNAARAFYDRAFVPPPTLDDLRLSLSPSPGRRKVVVVDGHPRSGKTWSVVEVIAELIESLGLSPEEYWTSGLDSLKAAGDEDATLASTLRAVAGVLSCRQPLRLVFLDDVFGTNRIRSLQNIFQEHAELARYFLWNLANPFLSAMADDSLLVVTSRSLHITLIESLFSVDLRLSADRDNVTVESARRGLFRTSRRGDPFGTFDPHSLKQVCKKNREFHPFAALDQSAWLIMAAPLLAFDEERTIPEIDKKDAAGVLFGDDFRCLAEVIEFLERESRSSEAAPPSWLAGSMRRLRAAYLVLVAPGLVFLDPAAYKSFGMEEALSSILVRSLYLYESVGEFRSGRLPNELYMIALDTHLREYLSFSARVFVAAADTGGNNQSLASSLGLRGFIERALHSGGSARLEELLSVEPFNSYVLHHQRETQDPLVHLEITRSLPDNIGVALTPGLIAAIGWSLYNFRGVYGREQLRGALEDWFPRVFSQHVGTPRSTSVPRSCDAVAVYSTFLQWVLKICDKAGTEGDATPDWASAVVRVPEQTVESLRDSLEMVLEDEIVWAMNEDYHLSPSIATFIIERIEGLRTAIPDEGPQQDEPDANRFFSLAWHNEWMEGAASAKTDLLREWMNSQRDRLRSVIAQQPGLISSNLSYHWCHFITQRAVWMRDWCFSDNPLEFERRYSRITKGSNTPSDNADLKSLGLSVFNKGDADSVKTVMLLVGTRAARIPAFDEFEAAIWKRFESSTREEALDLRCALLHSVFELVRQGFFDPFGEDTTEECRLLCLRLVNESEELLSPSWATYWASLQQHTHRDVLPREHDGWRDVVEALQSKRPPETRAVAETRT